MKRKGIAYRNYFQDTSVCRRLSLTAKNVFQRLTKTYRDDTTNDNAFGGFAQLWEYGHLPSPTQTGSLPGFSQNHITD